MSLFFTVIFLFLFKSNSLKFSLTSLITLRVVIYRRLLQNRLLNYLILWCIYAFFLKLNFGPGMKNQSEDTFSLKLFKNYENIDAKFSFSFMKKVLATRNVMEAEFSHNHNKS